MTFPNSGGTGYLGSRGASTVVLDPANLFVPGSWVATFRPQDLYPEDFEVYHIAMTGPAGGFRVFLDNKLYSLADRSDQNEYDPQNAMYVRRGQTISFHFRSASAPAPDITIFARQPQQGIF